MGDESGAACAAATAELSSAVTDQTRRVLGLAPSAGDPSPSESVMVFPSLWRGASAMLNNSLKRLLRDLAPE